MLRGPTGESFSARQHSIHRMKSFARQVNLVVSSFSFVIEEKLLLAKAVDKKSIKT